jgi:F-type H+-transporting ATPase subunit c
MRNKFRSLLLSVGSFLIMSAPVFAQGEASYHGGGITDKSLIAIAVGFGMASAAAFAALADSRAISAACEGAARNPGAAARIQTLMLIGLVLIETLVLFTFAMIFLKLPAITL